jgi:hypothetical protein
MLNLPEKTLTQHLAQFAFDQRNAPKYRGGGEKSARKYKNIGSNLETSLDH